MRAVIRLFFLGHELVALGDRHVNSHAIRISLVMRVIRLLDRDITAIDVITKLFQSLSIILDEVINVFSLIQSAIGNVDGQLHNTSILERAGRFREAKHPAQDCFRQSRFLFRIKSAGAIESGRAISPVRF
jgi:hypothetical protein